MVFLHELLSDVVDLSSLEATTNEEFYVGLLTPIKQSIEDLQWFLKTLKGISTRILKLY